MAADRNLLFGILALQMDFISREQLIAAMNGWVLAKHRPLGELLVEQGALTASKRQLLEPLVDQHVKDHANDPQRSLASLSSASSIGRMLQVIPDDDVQASLGCVGADSDKTRSHAPAPTDEFDGIRYRVLRPHARGGLGEVYVARDTELNREVALKEIQKGKDRGDSRTRFLLEAEVTGGLEHPGIVPVYGLGQYPDGRPYYVMRFIKGDNLGTAIKQFHAGKPDFNSLDFRRLLQRFIDVCQAIAYAHSRGVLHRDLKPGNIMLGKYGETLVVDWGLAKTQTSRERERPDTEEPTLIPASGSNASPTIHGSAIGTPAYMSPEQAEGKLEQLGPASDVYSLGATLYHLLIGQPPNADCDVMEMLSRCQQGKIPSPIAVNPAVPKALNAVCMKAMAYRPADRYGSAVEFAADVEHWLADEPVQALAEPLSVRAMRWARKHPGPVASLAASMLVGLIGLGAGLYFVNAERKQTELARRGEQTQRQEAQKERDEAQRQRDETEAVLKFVENRIFAAARPEDQEGGLGKDVTLERAVAVSLPFVEEGYKNRPLTEARLRMSLGLTFWYLGRADVARNEYSRARELYSKHRGDDDPSTLHSMNNLATTLAALGHYTEALSLREQCLKTRTDKLGRDHPDTFAAMNNLANSFADLNRHQDAVALHTETLERRSAKLGRDHPDTLQSMLNLANSLAVLGKYSEALSLRKASFELSASKLGPDHPDTLMKMNNLAISYADLGRHAEALKLREATLRLRRKKLGDDHPDTLESMHNLALSYRTFGRHSDSIALKERAFQLYKTKFGPDHPDTLRSMNSLTVSLTDLGRHEEAAIMREDSLRRHKARFGHDHPGTLSAQTNLGLTYLNLNRVEDARLLLADSFQRKLVVLPADHQHLFVAAKGLGDCLSAMNKAEEVAATADRYLRHVGDLPGIEPSWISAMLILRNQLPLLRRDADGSRKTAELWEKWNRKDASSLYDAACFRAVTAGLDPSGDDADKAMDWLRKAVAAGYKDLAHMKKDTDLDALREREDFKALIAEMEKKR